ncbi:hypothetical protein GCM10009787_63460 [Streptomyces bangladeshensis]|uniref:Uncharacterized protein n=1 Tax=Streptomyces bangladeshensis TaxID=295352 RepID=A0ABN3C1C6_9ACTN
MAPPAGDRPGHPPDRPRLREPPGSTRQLPPDAGAWARPCTERRPCTAERGRSRERVHRQLTEAATAWQQLDRDGGALHRGVRLTLATGLDRPSPTDLESAFLDAGVAARAAEEAAVRRRARLRRQAVALLTVLLLVATATAVRAVRARRIADAQRDIAVSRELWGRVRGGRRLC